jgi:hypothetical protein
MAVNLGGAAQIIGSLPGRFEVLCGVMIPSRTDLVP